MRKRAGLRKIAPIVALWASVAQAGIHAPGVYSLEGHFLRESGNPDAGAFVVNEGITPTIRFHISNAAVIPAAFKDRQILLKLKINTSCDFRCDAAVLVFQKTVPANLPVQTYAPGDLNRTMGRRAERSIVAPR